MNPIHILSAVDTHTAGEPMRVVVGGIPPLKGKTVNDKMNYFKKNYDFLTAKKRKIGVRR